MFLECLECKWFLKEPMAFFFLLRKVEEEAVVVPFLESLLLVVGKDQELKSRSNP